MSLRDKIIQGLDTTLKVGIPVLKKTVNTISTVNYHLAKHNLENNIGKMSSESINRAERTVERYETQNKGKGD